ncbi:MAG: metallophosphoesterase family protein [Methanocellales archaeon]
MKIALIGDIHANLPALEKVLEALDNLKVDRVYCAGDIVGYYPYPNEVIRLLRRRKIKSVMGNHDCAVVNGDTSRFNPYAAKAIEWTRENITAKSFEYLSKLPMQLKVRKLSIAHGSTRSLNEYIYPETPKWVLGQMLVEVKAEILVLGHTHIPWSCSLKEGLIINPGSVGQPRDGNPNAAFAVFDTKTKNIIFHRIEYDIHRVIEATMDAGLPDFLAYRLLSGV